MKTLNKNLKGLNEMKVISRFAKQRDMSVIRGDKTHMVIVNRLGVTQQSIVLARDLTSDDADKFATAMNSHLNCYIAEMS